MSKPNGTADQASTYMGDVPQQFTAEAGWGHKIQQCAQEKIKHILIAVLVGLQCRLPL
jgi:hypothetical protein